jgi:hypothetical protein
MTKRILIAALTAALFTVEIAAQDVAAKEAMAILPFTGGTGTDGETAATLFMQSRELDAAFRLVPRTKMAEAIGAEQYFQELGMTDPKTTASRRQQIGAKYLVTGNITKLGDQNLLIILILDTETLRLVAGDFQTYGNIEDIREKQLPVMARKVVAMMRRESSGAEKLAVLPVTFQSASVDRVDREVASTLAQILSIYLIRDGKYAVYPRTEEAMEKLREEHEKQGREAADENMVSVGKGDNPWFVLTVEAQKLGTRKMFNAMIIDLVTRDKLPDANGSEEYDTLSDGIEAMDNLVRQLTGGQVIARTRNFLTRSDAWENSRIYAGARLGGSPRFYGLSPDVGPGTAKAGGAFEIALHGSFYLLNRFGVEAGLQTELWFGTDTVSYTGTDDGGDFTASFTSSTLEIPLLAKLWYRMSNKFVISLFTGPYFSIPLGELEYDNGSGTDSYKANIPAGWLIGIAPGIRLGPGTLFADIRYGGDFGKTSISDSKGVLSVYSRNMASFTLGYEFGFMKRR